MEEEEPLEEEMATHSSSLDRKNPVDRGAWRAIVHGSDREVDMTEHTHTYSVHLYLYPVIIIDNFNSSSFSSFT